MNVRVHGLSTIMSHSWPWAVCHRSSRPETHRASSACRTSAGPPTAMRSRRHSDQDNGTSSVHCYYIMKLDQHKFRLSLKLLNRVNEIKSEINLRIDHNDSYYSYSYWRMALKFEAFFKWQRPTIQERTKTQGLQNLASTNVWPSSGKYLRPHECMRTYIEVFLHWKHV